jgi:hypothetical protein
MGDVASIGAGAEGNSLDMTLDLVMWAGIGKPVLLSAAHVQRSLSHSGILEAAIMSLREQAGK